MRIRSIKPEFWSHRVMGRQPDLVKGLALALLNYADDEGYFWWDPEDIRSKLRPFDSSTSLTTKALQALLGVGWVESLVAVGLPPSEPIGRIGRVVNFLEHQRIDKPQPSKIRRYWRDDSTNVRRTVDEASKNLSSPFLSSPIEGGLGGDAPRPTSPPGPTQLSPGDAFWAWFQDERERDGHVRERYPGRTLSAWWSGVLLALNGDEARAKAAARHYLTETKSKGAPWKWFYDQWERYASKGYGASKRPPRDQPVDYGTEGEVKLPVGRYSNGGGDP